MKQPYKVSRLKSKKNLILLAVIIFIIIIFFQQILLSSKPNILLISLDGVRPDHLSCYGYKRDTSPHIDRIAKNGVIFTNAFSTSTWTFSSIPSIATSLYARDHGLYGFYYDFNLRPDGYIDRKYILELDDLDKNINSLGMILKKMDIYLLFLPQTA